MSFNYGGDEDQGGLKYLIDLNEYPDPVDVKSTGNVVLGRTGTEITGTTLTVSQSRSIGY